MRDRIERKGLQLGLHGRLACADRLRVLHRAALRRGRDVDGLALEADVRDVDDRPSADVLRDAARALLDRLCERLLHVDDVVALLWRGLLRPWILTENVLHLRGGELLICG